MPKSKTPQITISGRQIGLAHPPLVVAEIGINHEGSVEKAKQMIDAAKTAGAECVKFQCHVVTDEMVPAAKKTIPGNAKESIWDIMERASFDEATDRELKAYTEKAGLIYLSTPFSRAAAERLHRMNVDAYKIGSGECNNYPLIEHIAGFGKPIIISTGMNDLKSVRPAVQIFKKHKIPYALMHVTSMYPTPYDKVRLGALAELQKAFPDAVVGLSDHTVDNYACLAAAALGASILERHFTADKAWPGPDVPISMDPKDLAELVQGSRAIHQMLGGKKAILPEEQVTIDFAYATAVSIKNIKKGEKLSKENIWVKRPGTGEIKAVHFKKLLGKKAKRDILADEQLKWSDFSA